jgi:hypothetical protein
VRDDRCVAPRLWEEADSCANAIGLRLWRIGAMQPRNIGARVRNKTKLTYRGSAGRSLSSRCPRLGVPLYGTMSAISVTPKAPAALRWHAALEAIALLRGLESVVADEYVQFSLDLIRTNIASLPSLQSETLIGHRAIHPLDEAVGALLRGLRIFVVRCCMPSSANRSSYGCRSELLPLSVRIAPTFSPEPRSRAGRGRRVGSGDGHLGSVGLRKDQRANHVDDHPT